MRSLTLVRKNLFRKKLRFSLLFISILIAFLLYGMLASVKTLLETGGDAAQANRMVTMNKVNFTQPLPISYLNRIRAIPGVIAATHNNWFGGYFQKEKNFMVVFAVEPESYLKVYPDIVLTDAERKTFLTDRTSILVGKQEADKYGWKVGQTIPLFSNIYQQKNGSRSWNFKIAGIWTSAKANQPASFSVFNWEYFNETRSFGKDFTGNVTFLTANEKVNADVKKKIDSSFENSPYATDTVSEQQFAASFVGQLGNIGAIIALVIGASFATILIIVGNTMVMAVRERTREIGIMKTLGFSVQRIMAMIVGEAVLISLIGGLAGLGLAYLAAYGLKASGGPLSGIYIPTRVWISGIGWMILLGLLTSAIPALNALKLNIVTALGRK
jgi:putative ABC transport system permease protein